jgi:hypothetical protein
MSIRYYSTLNVATGDQAIYTLSLIMDGCPFSLVMSRQARVRALKTGTSRGQKAA